MNRCGWRVRFLVISVLLLNQTVLRVWAMQPGAAMRGLFTSQDTWSVRIEETEVSLDQREDVSGSQGMDAKAASGESVDIPSWTKGARATLDREEKVQLLLGVRMGDSGQMTLAKEAGHGRISVHAVNQEEESLEKQMELYDRGRARAENGGSSGGTDSPWSGGIADPGQELPAEYPFMWLSVDLNRWVWLLRVFFGLAAVIGLWAYRSVRRRGGQRREED